MAAAKRNDVIDALRGVAIILVLIFHYTVRYTPPRWPTDLYGFDHVFDARLALGRYGVHIFFVISGLVITMTALRAKSALDFAVKRVARIIPALAVAALITLAICQFGPPDLRRTPLDFLATFTFMPDKLGREYVDGVYWSLSIEMRFYAWVAASALILGRRFWMGLLVPAALSLFITSGAVSWFLIVSYWPFFFLGMAIWYALFERERIPAVVLGLAGAGLLFFRGEHWLEPPSVLLVSALMAALLMREPRLFVLPWIGRISYSLYLIHNVIGVILIGALTRAGAPDLVAIAVAVALMILASWVLFERVEGPGQRLVLRAYNAARVRWSGPPAPAAVSAAADPEGR